MAEQDTRPAWMLDPTINDVDEDAIAAIGKAMDDSANNAFNSSASQAFMNRGGADPDTTTPAPPAQAPSSVPADEATGATTDDPSSPPPVQSQPSTDPATDPNADPGTGEAPAVGTFFVKVPTPQGETTVAINQEQALALLQQHNWLHSRPEEVQAQWAQIEQGTHRAVPANDYAAYEAWLKAGRPTQQSQSQRPVDLRDVDPDVAEYIQRLEQQAQPPVNAPAQAPTDTPQYGLAEIQRQAQEQVTRQAQIQAALNDLRQSFSAEYNLTQQQLTELELEVGRANIIPALNQRHEQRVGSMVVAPADPRVVLNEAFEAIMATHPVYKAIRDETIYNKRLARDREMNKATDSKKAVAGSLAHTPSAAVPSNQGNSKPISQMTPQEAQAAMVAELAQLIASGEAIN